MGWWTGEGAVSGRVDETLQAPASEELHTGRGVGGRVVVGWALHCGACRGVVCQGSREHLCRSVDAVLLVPVLVLLAVLVSLVSLVSSVSSVSLLALLLWMLLFSLSLSL